MRSLNKHSFQLVVHVLSSSYPSEGTAGKHQRSKVVWVPNKLLHCFYQIFPEDRYVLQSHCLGSQRVYQPLVLAFNHRLLVERCLLTCVVPVALPEKEKMEKLLTMYATLDTHASK